MAFLCLFIVEACVHEGGPLVFVSFLPVYNSASPVSEVWDMISGMDMHKPKGACRMWIILLLKIKKGGNFKSKKVEFFARKDLSQALNNKSAVYKLNRDQRFVSW